MYLPGQAGHVRLRIKLLFTLLPLRKSGKPKSNSILGLLLIDEITVQGFV